MLFTELDTGLCQTHVILLLAIIDSIPKPFP